MFEGVGLRGNELETYSLFLLDPMGTLRIEAEKDAFLLVPEVGTLFDSNRSISVTMLCLLIAIFFRYLSAK